MKALCLSLSLTLIVCFGLSESSKGQEVVLHENVEADTTTSVFGPGRKHFLHIYLSMGSSFGKPASPGAAILPHRSLSREFGLRYKLKLLDRWELGAGLRYTREKYGLVQNEEKLVFGPEQHEKEHLILDEFGGNVFTRFVFGKRGDFTGTFLDLGVFGDLSLGKKHRTVDEFDRPKKMGAKKVEIERKGLTSVRDLHYGFMARLGYSRYAIYGRYRYSDIWRENAIGKAYPELPRFTVGLQIGFHK